jgi:tripartite-type tricarboxylate transporter receptor subunit TctC
MNRRDAIKASAVTCLLAALPAAAQDYPVRPIKLIVPFAAGGPSDTQARMIAQKLSEDLKQPVLVDNKPGAAGNIGADLVAKASPDGYTLLFSSTGPLVVNPAVFERMPFDTFKDFAPVVLVSSAPSVLAVHPSVPAETFTALLALVKASPEKYSYASGGEGTTQHMSGELLKEMAGVRMTHVPYKGGGPAISDALAGHVPIIFTDVGTGLPHFRAGRLRPLAVTSPARNPALPQVPTLAESGLPGYAVSAWQGILAPADTPPPIVARLNTAVVVILRSPEVSQRLTSVGNVPGGNTPAEFAAFLREEAPRWARIVKAAAIKPAQ